jgi:hypothetical protein
MSTPSSGLHVRYAALSLPRPPALPGLHFASQVYKVLKSSTPRTAHPVPEGVL